jgi:hypothetical protein
MLDFKQFLLSERKQVGTLYHFTSLKSLIGLLKSDFNFISNNGHISFARDYQLPKTVIQGTSFSNTTVRIDFAGDKLSDKYKVRPLLGLKDISDNDVFDYSKKRVSKIIDRESETIITGKNYHLKPYIAGIQIRDVDLDDNLISSIRNTCENIPLNIVRQFTLKEITSIDVYNQLDLELYTIG